MGGLSTPAWGHLCTQCGNTLGSHSATGSNCPASEGRMDWMKDVPGVTGSVWKFSPSNLIEREEDTTAYRENAWKMDALHHPLSPDEIEERLSACKLLSKQSKTEDINKG